MEAARHLLSACLKRGITNFVLCPGARNAPLILMLQRTVGLELYYHPDERGAAFFALGRTMSFSEPCAVITTSGTAVAECLPAVIEAHYQSRPLVIISADRPDEYRDSGAPQAIDQIGIFGQYAAHGENYSDGVLRDWDGTAPLHVNLPLEEEIDVTEARPLSLEDIGEFKVTKAPFDGSLVVDFLRDRAFAGVIVMIGGLRPSEREEVFHFVEQLGVPVVADPHSGLREALANQILPQPEKTLKENPPAKVLRLGEVPHGRYWRDLEGATEVEVLSITNSGYPGLSRETTVVKGGVDRILRGIGAQEEIGDTQDYLTDKLSLQSRTDELLEAFPSSEPGLMRTLSLYACTGESIYLGNSLPIREWSSFAQREIPITEVWANRGANGIDGQIATWLGTSLEVEEAWAIIGDLTALYDLNALVMSPQVELTGRRLVIINNGGGQIFSQLPRLAAISPEETDRFTQSHQLTFQHYAEMWGWDYLAVRAPEDFDQQEENANPMVIEVLPDRDETSDFWKCFRG